MDYFKIQISNGELKIVVKDMAKQSVEDKIITMGFIMETFKTYIDLSDETINSYGEELAKEVQDD